jgi:preprotein translocase SecF subunit
VVPLEDQLLARVRKELGTKATLIEVELLGQSAALDNTLSSLANAAWGVVVLFILCALLYISLTVPFWIVVALAVDVTIVLALVLASGLPIDYPMIAAFLTFAGYSINDSIVVCHEIRAVGKPLMPEMVKKKDPKLKELIRSAIGEGLRPLTSRVFLTSFTTMLAMVPLLFCDGVLRTFGVIFVFGTLFGTLSSVYIVGLNARDVVMGDTQVV